MIKIHIPTAVNDVLGLKWRGRYVGDIFIKPYFGLYYNDGIFRRRYKLWPKPTLVSIQVVDAVNAARIFRRTMTPYVPLYINGLGDDTVMCMSYPFVEDGEPYVMVRMTPMDPTSLKKFRCVRLRPIKLSPRVTGISANDPLCSKHTV